MTATPTGLAQHLARRIRVEGPLTVAAWMAECLGHPQYGYYMTRDPLGAAGDFTTAPEISQMFGELIGLWCADTWSRIGMPRPVRLVELGPGRGTLMADALRAARMVPPFAEALRLHLVETSPVLRRHQAQTLQPVPSAAQPSWHDRLDQVPDGPLLLVANEFFDALPIRQLQKTERGWVERRIDLEENDRFRFVLDAAPSPLAAFVPAALRDAPPGSLFELCPLAETIMREIAGRLVRHGGAALIIDYGHAAPGLGETLQAVRRHAYAPVLEAPGEVDLTAHVDFLALAEVARRSGAAVFGPITQADFLVRLGIRERAAALLRRASPAQATEIRSALHRLLDETEMGTLFKVLALTAPAAGCPAGFPPSPAHPAP